jgi:flagellar assembly protein FliH
MSEPVQRFSFDTVFDGAGTITEAAPRPKRLYPIEEVEQIRALAHAEGERAALASIAAQQANALSQIAAACNQALPKLAEVAHEHREGSAALAMACARAIADTALDLFPGAPAQSALDALAREIEAQPRLAVSCDPAIVETLQATLNEAARALGFEGAIVVRPDGEFGRHAFTLDFGDGQAAFDPEAAAQRVAQALKAALAAEGLHAEPLIPGSES